jgi:hypothetical protein
MNLFGSILPDWLSLKQYLQIGILPNYRRATYSPDIQVAILLCKKTYGTRIDSR